MTAEQLRAWVELTREVAPHVDVVEVVLGHLDAALTDAAEKAAEAERWESAADVLEDALASESGRLSEQCLRLTRALSESTDDFCKAKDRSTELAVEVERLTTVVEENADESASAREELQRAEASRDVFEAEVERLQMEVAGLKQWRQQAVATWNEEVEPLRGYLAVEREAREQAEAERDEMIRAAGAIGGADADCDTTEKLVSSAGCLMVAAIRMEPAAETGLSCRVDVDGRMLEVFAQWADMTITTNVISLKNELKAERLARVKAELERDEARMIAGNQRQDLVDLAPDHPWDEVERLTRELDARVLDIAGFARRLVTAARNGALTGEQLDEAERCIAVVEGEYWDTLALRPSECRRFVVERLADVREAARGLGYAVTIHGSGARDVDLVAVPWTDAACSPVDLVDELMAAIGRCDFCNGDQPGKHPHGRLAWSIWMFEYSTYLDLSVTPRAEGKS